MKTRKIMSGSKHCSSMPQMRLYPCPKSYPNAIEYEPRLKSRNISPNLALGISHSHKTNQFEKEMERSQRRTDEAFKGFTDFANKTIEEVKEGVEYAGEKVKETIPVVKGYAGFAEEKGNESVKGYAGAAEEEVKGFVGSILEKLNKITPGFVKDGVQFTVDQAKQHPYLSGCIVLFVWWTTTRGGAAGDDEETKNKSED